MAIMSATQRPNPAPATDVDTGLSLARWISYLGPGSPCFCCGSSLEAMTGEQGPRLVCLRCGAEMAPAHGVRRLRAA